MLVNLIEMLEKAKNEKYAVPHFNINNLEWTKYILEIAEEMNSPVILGVSEGASKYIGGYYTVVCIVKGLIMDLNITVPVCLHTDHTSSYEECIKAINSGFTSVMIDASKFSLEKNIEITKKVTNYAKDFNVSVEAEIGYIGESEDNINATLTYAQTNDAIKLVKETSCNALAPALGSIYGLYKGEPSLDFDKMKEISDETNISLVLHGGTGISDNKIKKAINCGICKININTDLQIVWANSVTQYMHINKNVYDPRKIVGSGEKAIKNKIREKIILFGAKNKA